MRKLYLILVVLLSGTVAFGQTTIFTENFESAVAPAFPASWTLVNGSAGGRWCVGNTTAFGSNQSAYISDNPSGASSTFAYTNTTVKHLYKDVTVPAGEGAIVLQFDWRCQGESTFDYMRVFLAPTTFTPVDGTLPATGTSGVQQVGLDRYNGQFSYVHESIVIPASYAGTTFRLIFTWRTDGSGISQPVSLDNIQLTSRPTVNPAALTGTKTIGGSSPDYATFRDAIKALNTEGVGTGGVTFMVRPGVYGTDADIEADSIITVNEVYNVSASNPISFVKQSGTVTVERIGNSYVGTSVNLVGVDYLIGITGGDYITFDGIDVRQSSAGTAADAGYFLRNYHATNGATNNTIKNASITLDRSNAPATGKTNSYGVLTTTGTAAVTGGGTVPTSAAGANSGNKFYNLTIKNVYSGVYFLGTAAFPDIGTEIGTTSAASFNIIGDDAVSNDIGNGAGATFGIRGANQSGIKIYNNKISNITYTGTGTGAVIDGILVETFQGNSAVYNNKISGLKNTSTTAAGLLAGIRATHTTTGTHNLKIYNNLISNITSAYTGAVVATRAIKGIFLSATGGLTTQSFEVDFNSVNIDGSTSPNLSSSCFEIAVVTGPVFKVRNNIFANFTTSQTGVAKHYTWVSTSATSIGNTGSISNYNDLYIANTGNGFVGLGSSTDKADLAAWQAVASNDMNSTSQDPIFVSATDPHLQPSSPLDGLGTPIAGISTDIDNEARDVTNPEVGADELPPSVAGIDMRPIALLSPAVSSHSCYDVETIKVTVKNNSTSPIDLSVKNVTVTVNVTGAGSGSFSTVLNSGTLAGGATLDVTMAVPTSTLNMAAAGTYTFSINTSVTGDGNLANDNLTVDRTKETLTAGSFTASQLTYCASGTPQLTATGINGYSSFKWQQSNTSGSGFSDIPGGTVNPFTVPAITQTTFFRAVATCGSGTDIAAEVQVDVNNPQITGTTPGSRCGPGTVDLVATTSASDLNWYTAASGGSPVGNGNVFTTPIINTTTTYYVAGNEGGAAENMPTPTVGTSQFHTTTAGWGLRFTVNATATINTVKMYPSNSSAGAATLQVKITDLSDVVLYSGPVYNFSATTGIVEHTVPVGITVPPGNYKMVMSSTGINNLVRESSGVTFPYTALSNAISITAGANGTGTAQTTSSYYWFYAWNISTGCEGTRVPVVATINTPPALTITASKTICNNAVHPLQVTSTVSDFNSYIWDPQTDLYTDAAATIPYTGSSTAQVYVKTTTSGAVTYTLSAVNNTTQCTNVATTTVTTMPDPVIASSVPEICASGSVVLSLNPSTVYGAGKFQWQSSSNGVSYNDIGSATNSSYTTPTLTQTTYYKLILKDQADVVCSQPTLSMIVNNPQVTGTTPGTRCGTGTVDLSAAGSGGTTLNWYAASTGGVSLGTGNTFTTPTISTSTNFYVGASSGVTNASAGLTASTPTATSGAGTTNFGLMFDAITPFTLNTVTIYPVSASSASGTVTIDVINGTTGAVIHTATVNVTGSPAASAVPQVVTLDFHIQAGTNYKLRPGSYTGISGLLFEPSAGAPSGGNYGYPFTIPGVLSINTSTLTAVPTNTARNDLYYYFYNWQVSVGCEGVRTPVMATVTTPPTLTATASKTICNNTVDSLKVTSTISDFNSYVWSPQTNLYTDAAATIPYTGTSATQVYVKSATAGATTYTVTAENTTSFCANAVTSVVTVMPDPVINSSITNICVSGTASLTLTPATGYGAGSLQWQSSLTGSSYSDIGGATAATYNTGTLTQTTYYKMLLKDQAGTLCAGLTVTITVNNPQVLSTVPASRCGSGSVTLSATASAGNDIKWYQNSTGGSAVYTGNDFITPSLNANTTYYAAAGSPGGAYYTTAITSTPQRNYINSTAGWGMYFSVSAPCTLASVDIYPQGSGTVTIVITDPSNNVLYSSPVANVSGSGYTGPAVTVPVNIALPVGDYKIGWTHTGITDAGAQNIGTIGYPFSTPVLTVTSGAQGGAPVANVYYWFYNWKIEVGCESPTRTAVLATINPTASNAAGAVGTTECTTKVIAGTTEYNYTDCDLIATITPSGASQISGSVNSCVKIDATVQTSVGEPYVQRHYDITPAVNPATATSIITLYYLQSEFDAFNLVRGVYAALPTNGSDAAGKASIRITQYNGTGTAPGNYTGTAVDIDPIDANIVWNSTLSRWEITFSATGSGGFYVHTGKFVLPVSLLNFKGEIAGNINKLSWSTSTETNNKGFELQRSADGRNFSALGFVNTKADNGNSTQTLNYSFNDNSPLQGNNYYRLKQVDRDGKSTYSNVVLLSRKVKDITLSSVYPNPTTKEINLVITSPRAEKLTIIITDLTGKVVKQQPMSVVVGENQQAFNVQQLAQGTYLIKAVCANGCETAVHRFVKQ